MAELRLRDVDNPLWLRVKDKARYEGRSIRFVVLALLRAYADHGFQVVEVFNGKPKGRSNGGNHG